MKITPKDTVRDIVIRNQALFMKGAGRIVEALKDTREVQSVPMKRRMWFDKALPIKDINNITLGELNVIESRKPSYDYFCATMAIMLGLARFNRIGPDGKPDWDCGFSVDDEQIGRLRFLPAYRCFMSIQKGIDDIAKAWKSLEMPLSASERKHMVKRPNRGLTAVCRSYCQIMNGGVTMNEAWNTPWATVYEAFESCKYDNMEKRAMYEASKAKSRI